MKGATHSRYDGEEVEENDRIMRTEFTASRS